MDAFEAKYWSRLHTLLWICSRRKKAVRWSAHEPGTTQLLDLDIGPDVEPPDDLKDFMTPRPSEPPYFDSEQELISCVIINLGSIMTFDDAEKELIKALTDDTLRAYPAPDGGEFFESAAVRECWHAAAAVPVYAAAGKAAAREWLRGEVARGEKRMSAKKYQAEMMARFDIRERPAERIWAEEAPPFWKQAGRPAGSKD